MYEMDIINTSPENPDFLQLLEKWFWKHCGNLHLLLFPQCYPAFQGQIQQFKTCFTLNQMTIFRLVQIKYICRWQKKQDSKI